MREPSKYVRPQIRLVPANEVPAFVKQGFECYEVMVESLPPEIEYLFTAHQAECIKLLLQGHTFDTMGKCLNASSQSLGEIFQKLRQRFTVEGETCKTNIQLIAELYERHMIDQRAIKPIYRRAGFR